MRIYFSGSIRGGRQDVDLYARIIEQLKAYGEVLTEFIGQSGLTAQGSSGNEADIYAKDMAWLTAADVIVAEVTSPSLGVGYELAKAEEMRKPVLCLYRPSEGKKPSAMIAGCPHFLFRHFSDEAEVPGLLSEFFATATKND